MEPEEQFPYTFQYNQNHKNDFTLQEFPYNKKSEKYLEELWLKENKPRWYAQRSGRYPHIPRDNSVKTALGGWYISKEERDKTKL